jgi:hypothetical integral membrane protein (TIGR02206 family)
MIEHHLIQPLSSTWWIGLLSSIVVISFLLIFYKKKEVDKKAQFLKVLGFSFIIAFLISNSIGIYNGTWNIQDNLPLHLCRISFIISIIVLFTRKQWMYEWVLFLAIPSGLHSMLTPELTKGVSDWFYFEYYLVHAGLIFVPLFLTIVMGMKTREDAWWKTLLRVQIPVVLIMPFNFLIDSNYMFLKAKPLVDNPLLIGEWPTYIIFLELIMVVHVFIIYKLATK